jgi:hypothetical protein
MKKTAVLLVCCLLVVVLFLSLRPGKNPSAANTQSPVPSPAIATASSPASVEITLPSATAPQTTAHAPAPSVESASRPIVSQPPVMTAPPATSKAVDLDIMHEAMITYEPANLPIIARYLNHSDAELRKAALNNMLQMGDKAAAVLLREAAATAATPQEAVAMLEAAKYLELPSGLDLLNKKRARLTGKTSATPPTAPPPPADALPAPAR